ncbi:MAG TPA: hypothetical protein VD704_09030 [Gaiellaceae bacterium]|nr:hypothetical protein [Gaiellaceae bacterium]
MNAQGKHLLFVTKPSGYELVERDGEAPTAGAEVELEEGKRFTVTRLGPSPLPLDERACAYLQSA